MMITIVGMTWKEMLRKRVLLLTLILTAVFLLAFWFLAGSLRSDAASSGGAGARDLTTLMDAYRAGVMSLTLGFFFGSFVLAFLAIFSSFSAVSGEAETGVLQALLPRPVSRPQWYIGRWTGYVTVGLLYGAILFTAILTITGMHATVPGDPASWVRGYLLFASVVPLLVSLGMLGSCFFSSLGNGVLMTMLFGAGWLGGMIEKIASGIPPGEAALKPMQTIAGIFALLMPADSLSRRMLAELFSVSDVSELFDGNLTLGTTLGQIPSNAYLWYAVAYTAVMLAAGVIAFRRRDF
ncbi:ABC-type transport system involved in multi-copper enzyme maturation permease subunit [Paenibacillus mucilaginosus]|uniref:ABC transporter permease n=1 Tax=Paenibacillus mucilaginosus TaxID=61624 RepID=UPI003D1A9BF4